jgi:hypothetical protein
MIGLGEDEIRSFVIELTGFGDGSYAVLALRHGLGRIRCHASILAHS